MATETTPASPPEARRRVELIEELHRRYSAGNRWRQLRFLRKKYAWIIIVGGARLLKRTLDIVVALLALMVLGPTLFLVVGTLIKLTDGGPALFWQTRVGRWGREFPFPKFRSMVANAEEIKKRMLDLLKQVRARLAQIAEQEPDLDPKTRDGLKLFAQTEPSKAAKVMEKLDKDVRKTIETRSKAILTEMVNEQKDLDPKTRKILEAMQNDHANSITFKMKKDPRVTWVGKIIRKGSIDEMPQFWCVLKGEMSLVGPRPPVPSEVAEYTLAHRRRLDATPGLTCFWQVEGRGDIPFHQQVQRDIDYINSQNFWLDIWLLFKTVPAVLFGKGAY